VGKPSKSKQCRSVHINGISCTRLLDHEGEHGAYTKDGVELVWLTSTGDVTAVKGSITWIVWRETEEAAK